QIAGSVEDRDAVHGVDGDLAFGRAGDLHGIHGGREVRCDLRQGRYFCAHGPPLSVMIVSPVLSNPSPSPVDSEISAPAGRPLPAEIVGPTGPIATATPGVPIDRGVCGSVAT